METFTGHIWGWPLTLCIGVASWPCWYWLCCIYWKHFYRPHTVHIAVNKKPYVLTLAGSVKLQGTNIIRGLKILLKVIAAEKNECFVDGKVNNCPGSKEKISKCGRIQRIIDASKVRNHLDIHDLLEAGIVTHVFCHKQMCLHISLTTISFSFVPEAEALRWIKASVKTTSLWYIGQNIWSLPSCWWWSDCCRGSVSLEM